jgi:hypothetical protein
MTMFEDGIRGVGAEETFKVLDLAELVAQSLQPNGTARLAGTTAAAGPAAAPAASTPAAEGAP